MRKRERNREKKHRHEKRMLKRKTDTQTDGLVKKDTIRRQKTKITTRFVQTA